MEDFRRQFLSEAVETLEDLGRKLRSAEEMPPDLIKRETFRLLHTVKGTAQTFGLAAAGNLAHELETLLSDGDAENLLPEGIGLLQKSLTEQNFQIPEKFQAKLRAVIPPEQRISSDSHDVPAEIPNEIYSVLSSREKNILQAAMRDGKSLTVVEVGFGTANFAAELINFRELLSASGEIIATFPGAKSNRAGEIGFQFLTAHSQPVEDLAEVNPAAVVWSFSPPPPLNETGEILRQIARHGREIAAKLDKQIEIQTPDNTINLSPVELKLVFEVLLHLVRNAVDHAIEKAGKIEIRIKEDELGWRLSVADNGRGIDLEKIKAKANEKKLAVVENLNETEIINLIFQPEFSTKSEMTEISGRGVGLDAVKFAVEKFGGKITVATEKEIGTTFEIFLPRTENEAE